MKSRNQQKNWSRSIRQSRKYNQCLIYCEQQGEDLAIIQLKKVIAAHPTFFFLKAYQLLCTFVSSYCTVYKGAADFKKRQEKLDTTNDITLRYMHELSLIGGQKTTKKSREESVEYKLGNETIIQPAHGKRVRQISGKVTAGNIFAGY